EEVIRKVMGWNGAESSTPSQGATVIMKNWPEMTQNEKQEIANRVLLEIEKKSKTATHVNFYDVCGVLDLPSDVQSGVRNALEERGFINWVSMGIAHITTEGASYAAKLRSKPE